MNKAIIFDCFGVLATDIWLQFLDSLPDSTDKAGLSDINKAYDKGYISRKEYLHQVRAKTGLPAPDLETEGVSGVGKNYQLLELIGQLKTGYKLGILSNISSDWITAEFLTKEEQALFDSMTFSYEVGTIKPDPKIYQVACSSLDVQPEEVIMIDDREQYVQAAIDLGMKGIVYRNFSQFKSELNVLLDSNY